MPVAVQLHDVPEGAGGKVSGAVEGALHWASNLDLNSAFVGMLWDSG